MKTTPEEKIARFRAKPRRTIILDCLKVEHLNGTQVLELYPDGRYNLNGSWVLKSELPAWAHKYLRP